MTALVALLAVNGALLKKPDSLKPALALRGGLAGVEPEMAVKVASALMGTNAAVMYLAPEKAGEMYGMPQKNITPLASFFCEVSGAIFLTMAIAAWLSVANGMDLPTAIAWGNVPSCVQALGMLLNDKAGELGFGALSKWAPTVMNVAFTAALFGKLGVDTDTALKVWAAWGLLNGAGAYLAPDKFMEAWDASLAGGAEAAMAKFFGQVILCTSVLPAAVAFGGSSVLEGVAYAFAAFAITDVDALFIGKNFEAMGADQAGGIVWLVVEVLTALLILK